MSRQRGTLLRVAFLLNSAQPEPKLVGWLPLGMPRMRANLLGWLKLVESIGWLSCAPKQMIRA